MAWPQRRRFALLTGIAQAAESLGVQPPKGWSRAGLPWGVIRLGGLVVPMWRELAEMAYLWQVPHALDGRALEAAVGPIPGTALSDALRETLNGPGFGPMQSNQAIRVAG